MCKRHLFRTLRLSIMVLILALILCEIGLHIAVAIWAGSPAQSLTVPFPYGPAFEREHQTILDSMIIRDELRWIPDFHGEYFNITDNFRTTTDQPMGAKHTLWLFGSSTVMCLEVPDALTLPSYLQRLVGTGYRVQNMGVTSANTGIQLKLLKETNILPGDIIVFYDGAQDEIAPYYIILNRRQMTTCQRWLSLMQWSLLLRAACLNDDVILPTPDLTADVYQRYVRPIAEARAYAHSRGARFYHFLQPTIYTYPSREDERPMPLDFGPVMRASAALFRATPDTVDLSHALDALRSADVVVYVDWVHLTARGNEAIAAAIYATLFRAF